MATDGRKVKVCHLTSVHSSDDTRIFHKECCTLREAGFETHLVVPGASSQAINGVRIHGVPKVGSNRMVRMTKTVWNVYRTGCSINAHIYHLHDPELIPVGILLKLRAKRVIYDVHEDYSTSILYRNWIYPGFRSYTAKALAFAEWVSSMLLDGIAAATPTISRRFPASKTVTIHNFPVLSKFSRNESTPYPQRAPIVAYVGGIAPERGVREMVHAVRLLPENLGVKLWLVGSFSPKHLEGQIKQLPGWERVEFLGWQSRPGVERILGMARIGLVILHPTMNFLDSYPIKLFEYMSAGIPVIASDFPLWSEIIEKIGCGILVNPLDAEAIAKAMRWLLEHPKEAEEMGKQGLKAVSEQYNWEGEAKKLLTFYNNVLEKT